MKEPVVRSISRDSALPYLQSVGMEFGSWNEVNFIEVKKHNRPWTKHYAAKDRYNLQEFCFHAVSWLPTGKWNLLQFDNSSGGITVTAAAMLAKLLWNADNMEVTSPILQSCFLFDFGDDDSKNTMLRYTLSHILYLCLVFELHGQFVSAGSKSQIFDFQDGFAYFIGNDDDIVRARGIIDSYNNSRADWLVDAELRFNPDNAD